MKSVKLDSNDVDGLVKKLLNSLAKFINLREKIRRLCTPSKVIGTIKSQ